MLLDKSKGIRFFIGTAVIGAAAYALLRIVMPMLEQATAWLSAAILSLFGTASASGAIVYFNSLAVQILPLCVGDIEIAVLTGAILSTEDRKLDDRLLGVGAAFVFVMLINALRIAATMLAWQAWGLSALEAVHSTLFRVVLVVAIVGFYCLWYLRDIARLKLRGRLTRKR